MVEGIYQIRIHSRGGQGAKTAGIIIAESYIEQGDFAQAFAEYGPERSGAPMKTFVRLSKNEIRLHGDVAEPDMVVVMDDTLLGSVDVAEGLTKDGVLIVNTRLLKAEVAAKLSKKCKVLILDASGTAKGLLGKNLPNTVMAGAIAKYVPSVSYEGVAKKMVEKLGAKLSVEVVDKNRQALKWGYEAI